MKSLRWQVGMAAWLLLVGLGGAPPAAAAAAAGPTPSSTSAPANPIAAASATIGEAQRELAADVALARRSSGPLALARIVDRAEAVASEARQGVTTLAAALGDPRLTPARRSAIVADIARGGQIAAGADRLVAILKARPANSFDRSLAARTASPLGERFWSAAAAALPGDLARLGAFLGVQAAATWRGFSAGIALLALLGLVVAGLLLFPARLALRRGGQRFMVDRVPQSRLRRSGWALWTAVVGCALPWLAILIPYLSFRAAGMVSAPWQPFALGVVRGVAIAAAVSSVAGALLLRGQPSWRLLPVSDRTAGEIRPWTIAMAAAVFVTVVVDELIVTAGWSAPGRDLANLGETLLHVAVDVLLLLAITRARRRADAEADRADDRQETGAAPPADAADARRGLVATAVVGLVGWLAIGASLVMLATGYVALALLVARLLVWLPLVGAGLYLTWLVVDDLASETVSGDSAFGRALHRAFGVRASVVDQVGVAMSAMARLLLLLVAAVAAFAPFGSNLNELGTLGAAIAHGVTIGEITLAPWAILRGLVVLGIALFVVHRAERWLAESYLPKTELDDGARNSISTVARYVGLVLAFSWALAAFGIGFQRIALVLSALSVGIGFGLQAITQNFVSGLILLIERPVKIGDMVEVGGQKGDVKRISVRATQIQAADRSTLIVPNSELITKTVRNLTHADPMGVVQLKFTVPLDADVDAVRDIVLTLFKDAKTVFDTPAPRVFIDSLDDGVVHFACTAYCESPRAAYSTRSEVLFGLIMALRERDIAIGSSPAGAGAPVAAAHAPGSAGVIGHES